MRGEFEGGVCDGHSHPVGHGPPRVVAPLCTKNRVANGRYVLVGPRQVAAWNGLPAASDVMLYKWEPAVEWEPFVEPHEDPVSLVRAMWDAGRAGDMEGVLATLHPEVTWTPLNRPPHAAYSGHAGVEQLRAETDRHRGIAGVTVDDFVMTADGNVLCRGRSTASDGSVQRFESTYVMRDGLIASVATREVVGS